MNRASMSFLRSHGFSAVALMMSDDARGSSTSARRWPGSTWHSSRGSQRGLAGEVDASTHGKNGYFSVTLWWLRVWWRDQNE